MQQSFKFPFLPASLKRLPAPPVLYSLMQMCPQLFQISISSPSHPSLKHLSSTPTNWASLAGDRIPVWFHHLGGTKETGFVSITPVLPALWEAWHAQFCPFCFPRKFHRLRARLDRQAGSRGSIFRDSSYSVSSSMMRALSSKY